MLIKIKAGGRDTLISITLDDIAQVGIAPSNESFRYVRGTYSYVKLKNGKRYILSHDEAQRLIDVLHQSEGNR